MSNEAAKSHNVGVTTFGWASLYSKTQFTGPLGRKELGPVNREAR